MFSPTLQLRDLHSLERYFEYYERELRLLNLGRMQHGIPRNELAVKTHADILLVVEFLRGEKHLTKRQARDQLKQSRVRFSNTDEDALESSIDLSLRLWMMLNIREYELRLQTPQTPSLMWDEGESFENFLGKTFRCSKGSIETKDSRLDPSFTAAFMVDICGLRLEWTDCLADHLRLDRREKILRIFPYKPFLRNHLDHKQSHLPITVLKETILSLNLLFPQWDPPTIKLLQLNKQDFQDSGPYDGPRTLNLTEFDHWRDRLQEVYDVVFRSPPVSWAQLWKDRRNPQQFWTFWIALFILALTLVSTVTSIVQAWASVKSLHLT